jgi:tripartite-type tricarboxylate transporter receptor subunit TctC
MRRRLMKALAALPALGAPLARAQPAPAWPSRTVRVVVPSAAGSPWDPTARLLAERLAPVFGQAFVVENRSGATGMIGMDHVVKATDGHTLGVMFMPHVMIPALFDKVPYDVLRDPVPVAQTQWTYNVLVVHPSLPVRDMAELVAHARRSPGRLTLLSGGNGSPAHVMGEYFKQLTGTFMVHVPYRGPVAALQDLVGGQADLMFASAGAAIPLLRAQRLRALAVTSPQRLEALPEVPTFAEAGFPTFDVRDWAGIVASPSVPASALPRLNAEIRRALAEPGTAERFRAQGVYLETGTPEAFGALIRAESDKWTKVIRSARIKPE